MLVLFMSDLNCFIGNVPKQDQITPMSPSMGPLPMGVCGLRGGWELQLNRCYLKTQGTNAAYGDAPERAPRRP